MDGVVAMPALPAGIDVNRARLPITYEAAKAALAECVRIDECKDWADKAEALASYARQTRDSVLRRYCDRVQARAIRRCGELVNEIPDTNRGRPAENQAGTAPNLTRTRAATEAGLSERQRKTAQRVANVPGDLFEEAVEADEPATVTELAELPVHPVADFYPMLGEALLADLAESIRANGQRLPIMLDAAGEVLLDGRNRRAACKLARIEPVFARLPEGEDPVEFIKSMNDRRDMTVGQRALIAAKTIRWAGDFHLPESGKRPNAQKGEKSHAAVAKSFGLSQQRISEATLSNVSKTRIAVAIIVLQFAPDLADSALAA